LNFNSPKRKSHGLAFITIMMNLTIFFSLENPMVKLPQDVLQRGEDIYSIVLNYCIDLICWDKTDELPDYLDVT